jgi:integral membrane sensor domain MASE1
MYAIQIGAGILPPVLIGIVAYVTYVVIGVLCGQSSHNPALANTD